MHKNYVNLEAYCFYSFIYIGDPKDVTGLVLYLLAGKLRRPIRREGMDLAREKGGAQESLTVPAQSRTYTSMRTSLNKS